MYAVIKTGGRQAKVQEGDVLQVERIRVAGDVTFESILIAGDDGSIITDREALAKMPVKGKVLGEIRGKKVDVFHYRNKSGYRKSAGHRQTYTNVEITEIPGAPKKKAAAKKNADAPKAEKKPVAKKPAEKKADEPKAEQSPAAKEPAAKKPAAEKKTTKGEDE